MSKPKPVPKNLVCSECGLDWDEDNPHKSKSDCIEALKEKLEDSTTRTISCRCIHHCHGHCTGCNCYWYSYPNWTWTGGSSQSSGTFSFTDFNNSNTLTYN